MNLKDFPRVQQLQEQRLLAFRVLEAVHKGEYLEVNVQVPIGPSLVLTNVCEVVSLDDARQTIIHATSVTIGGIDKELLSLGVTPSRFNYDPSDLGWRHTAEMTLRAWSREIGSRRRKTHLIDELVVATSEMKAKADRTEAAETRTKILELALLEARKFVAAAAFGFEVPKGLDPRDVLGRIQTVSSLSTTDLLRESEGLPTMEEMIGREA